MGILPRSYSNFRMNSIFIRIFISIMGLVLTSIFIVAYISYQKSTAMVISEVNSSNMLILEQAKRSIDREVQSIETSAMQVALDRRLNKVLHVSREDSYSEAGLFQDSIIYLNSIKINNDYITDLWFYINKSDVVLGTEGKYDSEMFFNEIYKNYSNIDWDRELQTAGFRMVGQQRVEHASDRIASVVFIESMPVNENNPKGTLVISLSEQMFSKEMNSNIDGKIVANYVVDSQANIIYTNEAQYQSLTDYDLIRSAFEMTLSNINSNKGTINASFGKKPFTVQYVYSDVNDWCYISIMPTGYISEKANGIRDVTVMVILISIFFSMVITYFLVKRLYKPVNDILNYISIMNNKRLNTQKAGSKDEFVFINRIIEYVYKENEDLRNSYKKNEPVLREKYLDDIVNGRLIYNGYEEMGQDIGVHLPFPFFQVIVFEMDEDVSKSIREHKKFSHEFLTDIYRLSKESLYTNCRCYSLQKDDQTLVSVINANSNFYESEGINEYLNGVREYFWNNSNITFTVGVGQSYNGIENCFRSFIDALYAIQYKMVKGPNTVIYIDEVKKINGDMFEYSVAKEMQLINVVKSGDSASATRILSDILKDNLTDKPMAPVVINNLFGALIGTAIRSIYEMQSTIMSIFNEDIDIYAKIAQKDKLKDKKDYIFFIFRSVSIYAAEHKQGQHSKVYERIQQYVEENYSQEISLEKVAQVVNLSTSYLSFIFKEISGKNFVDFVNKFRLEKAKGLLLTTSMTVNQVAEAVGYCNANSFSKVFKKYIGVSPGQFRKM